MATWDIIKIDGQNTKICNLMSMSSTFCHIICTHTTSMAKWKEFHSSHLTIRGMSIHQCRTNAESIFDYHVLSQSNASQFSVKLIKIWLWNSTQCSLHATDDNPYFEQKTELNAKLHRKREWKSDECSPKNKNWEIWENLFWTRARSQLH